MAITYTKNTDDLGNVQIIKTDDNGLIWYVPAVEGNADYQAYLASLQTPTAQ